MPTCGTQATHKLLGAQRPNRASAFQQGVHASVGEAPPLPLEGAEAEVAGVDGVDRLDGHPPDAVLQAQPAEPDRRGDDVAPAGLWVGLRQEPVAAVDAGTRQQGRISGMRSKQGPGQQGT